MMAYCKIDYPLDGLGRSCGCGCGCRYFAPGLTRPLASRGLLSRLLFCPLPVAHSTCESSDRFWYSYSRVQESMFQFQAEPRSLDHAQIKTAARVCRPPGSSSADSERPRKDRNSKQEKRIYPKCPPPPRARQTDGSTGCGCNASCTAPVGQRRMVRVPNGGPSGDPTLVSQNITSVIVSLSLPHC